MKKLSFLAAVSALVLSCSPSPEDITIDLCESYAKKISLISESQSPIDKVKQIEEFEELKQSDIDSLLYQADLDREVVTEVEKLIAENIGEAITAEKENLYNSQKELVKKLQGSSWFNEESKNVLTLNSDEIDVLGSKQAIQLTYDDEIYSITADDQRLVLEDNGNQLDVYYGGKVSKLTSAIEENFILGSFSGTVNIWGSKNYFTLKLNSPNKGVLYAKFANGNSENYPIKKIQKLSTINIFRTL